jgi:hypothetical protein
MQPLQPPFASREERVAYNEAWARSVNEQRAEWMRMEFAAADGFRCECFRADCTMPLELSWHEWRHVRSQENWFAVAPRHIDEALEVRVEEHPHFWLIEKLGEAGALARKLA